MISALALVFLVLLHSGKGGGLSDMFGGGAGAAATAREEDAEASRIRHETKVACKDTPRKV